LFQKILPDKKFKDLNVVSWNVYTAFSLVFLIYTFLITNLSLEYVSLDPSFLRDYNGAAVRGRGGLVIEIEDFQATTNKQLTFRSFKEMGLISYVVG